MASNLQSAINGLGFLILGATGSFGRACIPELLKHGASRVVALARHEKEMFELERDCRHSNLRCYLGDVRDRDRLVHAMDKIDVVIHAAAMKRIEACERDPEEAKKTNVDGTQNVVNACLETAVAKAVLLSTDKAEAPINTYGRSKAMAEGLFLDGNNTAGGRCVFGVVRYGNIAGSRGSLIPIWREYIRRGEMVPVSDPEATRYWMTIGQAVDLVLDTVQHMRGGELIIPRLPAYRLADVAEAMGAKGMTVTGMPRWEKAHECLGGVMSNEARRMTIIELREAIAAL